MKRWDLIVDLLGHRESISQAGVFDLKGNILAATEGLELFTREAKGLINCFNDRTGSLFGIHVGSSLFRCFRAGQSVVIGNAKENLNRRSFAAMLTDECLLFCMMSDASTSSGTSGSVIGEMKSAFVNNGRAPSSGHLPIECRVQVEPMDELPLIDLGIAK